MQLYQRNLKGNIKTGKIQSKFVFFCKIDIEIHRIIDRCFEMYLFYSL